jgi:hypothetical protein
MRSLRASSGAISGPGWDTWGIFWKSNPPPLTLPSSLLRLARSIFWARSSKVNNLDLIVPFPGFQVDLLTRWVADEFYVFYYNLRKQFRRKRMNRDIEHEPYEEFEPGDVSTEFKTYRSFGTPIVGFRFAATTLIACLLPTGAIAILSTIHRTGLLIGVIGIFTFLFAIGLMFFTSAKPTRVEIFSATAA